MIPKDRRLPAALTLAAAAALAACSREPAALTLELARPPSTYLFRSHNIPVGWILTLEVVLEERSRVGVRLERAEFTALDRGTDQAFGFHVLERADLEREGLGELAPGGRLSFQPLLGLVPVQPKGPIAVLAQVSGTDRDGNAVGARLEADSPLATSSLLEAPSSVPPPLPH